MGASMTGETIRVDKGVVILSEGETHTSAYQIMSGRVERIVGPAMNVVRYGYRMAVSRLRATPLLVLACLYPTHRCNLRCLYCSSPYLDTPELTLNQWLTEYQGPSTTLHPPRIVG